MKLAIMLFAAVLMFSGVVMADEDNENQALENKYFSKGSIKLTPAEKKALQIAKRWNGSAQGIAPFPGPDGSVRFMYGASSVSIVCAVLKLCDVALQPGERVHNLNIGDNARWVIEPAISGTGSMEIQHLIIKPMDNGLETSLVVTTNRRVYHLVLRSHRTDYMPFTSFAYPEDTAARWEQTKARQEKERQERTIPKTGEYLGDLSFEYDIEGSQVAWKPTRVFNDGKKTIIEMPAAVSQTEAPSLLLIRKEGGWFSDDEVMMVNYRFQGNRYIVDAVFDKAILVAGVGRSQDRVTITRRKPK
jgi:type IV secretion system protein VirB9